MHQPDSQFEQRKQDHISLALHDAHQTLEKNPFDRMNLLHDALPDLNFEDIALTGSRFGVSDLKPFLVSSMTAGHAKASTINKNLMEACVSSGWVMGVGSQRRELFDKEALLEWQPLRAQFPKLTLFSNLGIAQLLQLPIDHVKRITESIQAAALIIHCNPLQEVIQPEGTPQFKGCWYFLERLVKELGMPIIVKETGCGFSLPTLKRLAEIGVAAVDVAGLGGTHWGRIEGARAQKNSLLSKTAATFKNWGIDTLRSVQYAASIKPSYEIWGSGGVRNGLDAAKLFALGVSTVGFAKPMLEKALESAEAVFQLMTLIEYELRVALFCTGSQSIIELKGKICP